jgi:hypothetical protein
MSEERTGKLNKKLAYCRDCGQPLEPGQGLLIAVRGVSSRPTGKLSA